ncbi:hypothetical protein BHE74_00021122 [Ensete ventricosum]|nr:hypothetical protein BHE74_00021122 [Ensete ventricosum]
MNNTTARRVMDSRSECHGTAEAGLRAGLDHTKNYPENIEVLKQGIKRGEEATTSSERLSYPKAKRRSKWRWTRRSVTMSQRRIYRSRRKGRKCKATNSSAMVPHRRYFHGVIDPLLSWRESVGR